MDDYTISKELKKIKLILTANGYDSKNISGFNVWCGYTLFFTTNHSITILRINHNYNSYTINDTDRLSIIFRCTKLKELSDHLKDHHEY